MSWRRAREARSSDVLVSMAIVGATLAAAIVGYLQVRSGNAGDRAAARSQRLAIESSGEQARNHLWFDLQFEAFARARLNERQVAASDYVDLLFPTEEDRRERQLAEARQRAVAARLYELAAELADGFTHTRIAGQLSPERDPGFPLRFLTEGDREGLRLGALEDAANAEAAGWGSKGAAYGAILTLFAAALYLLGFSFALPSAVASWFVRGGIAFLAVGAAWGVAVSLDPPAEPPREAAAHFADGSVHLASAFGRHGPEGFRAAEEAMTRALDLRPDFARALESRSDAIFFGHSPQAGVGTIATRDAYERAAADLERAAQLGLRTAHVLGNLGWQTFALGIEDDDATLRDRGIALTREVIATDPGRPIWRFNLGAMLLAEGRGAEAEAAFDDGIRAVHERPGLDRIWSAGALSVLEVVEHHRPDLAAAVDAAKERIVGGVFGHTRSPEAPVLPVSRLDLTPATLQFVVDGAATRGVDPEADTVTAQWYHRTDRGWFVLQEVSDTIRLGRAGPDLFALLLYTPFTSPPRCLEGGDYRVELYAHGYLAGEGTVTAPFAEQRTVVDRDLNAALCVPATWIASDVAVPGVSLGYGTEDGSRGVQLFRLPVPGGVEGLDTAQVLDLAVTAFATVLPGFPQPQGAVEHFFFMGLSDTAQRTYAYPGGLARAGIGVDRADGSVVVAMAWGPPEEHFGERPTLFWVFNSLNSFQPVAIP